MKKKQTYEQLIIQLLDDNQLHSVSDIKEHLLENGVENKKTLSNTISNILTKKKNKFSSEKRGFWKLKMKPAKKSDKNKRTKEILDQIEIEIENEYPSNLEPILKQCPCTQKYIHKTDDVLLLLCGHYISKVARESLELERCPLCWEYIQIIEIKKNYKINAVETLEECHDYID